ncbi:MAG: ABC-F family ATP-binding cassette domain-containing protein, partial [Muribaculaceae bacterium]|nr:ABC-F family ATP-binding cassette domain-containing protein [Muribaculaceae bacterium]
MIRLQIENLTKSIGARILFSDLSLTVEEGDKIGIVARNGSGKTTLLNIICGLDDYDSGKITFSDGIRVGYLSQSPAFDPEMTALDYARPEPHDSEDYGAEDRAKQMLSQLGITDFGQRLGTMSGGQFKRVSIAKVLLQEPDLLVLDEPTNHLDIAMVEWLENYLSRMRVTLIMVTHDRYFLDNVCTRILEIDREQAFIYDGNYDYYLRKRTERHEVLSAELAKVKNLLRTELEWMRRQPQARGSKAKYRIDSFHELEKRSHVNLNEKDVRLSVKGSYIGNKIFEAVHVAKKFEKTAPDGTTDVIPILNDFNYNFARFEKVGIVGDNGAGKSTFIKMLLGELMPDSGHFDVGETVRWGYYSQEGMTDFDEKKKVIDAVREIAETVRIDDKTTLTAQQFLTHFLFEPATQQKYIYKLSGGERRRLYLATVLMRQPNFLILDEPTKDLDIMTLGVLENYLADFKGCVIVVSHDRFFLDRIVDHLFVMKGDGEVRDFPGDYSTYRHCVRQEEKEAKAAAEEARKTAASKSGQEPTAPGKQKTERKPKLSFKEKKEMEALEIELESLGSEKSELEAAMSSGSMTIEEITAAGARMEEIIARLDEAEFRMLE